MRWIALLLLAGCLDEPDDLVDTTQDSTALCRASEFNCRFRAGDSRVTLPDGSDRWAIVPGASVRDGNGDVLIAEAGAHLTFNFGQTRALAGKAHALAVSTSNASAGWYPFDHIVDEAQFRAQDGNVDARDPHAGEMACYEIANTSDPALEAKKVVHDSHTAHERAGDYLPLVRANGVRSANLVFSVPGFQLGGATTDHFPAGTRFRRVVVPTDSGRPSISIPLWIADADGRFRIQDGTMRFLYGYIRAADGVKRFGWMAQDALVVSTGCD